jgi:SSS family solute:Na+ symporter
VGGWNALYTNLGVDFFDMWRPLSDPNFPWTGIAFGAPILGVWYWCTDQYIVQRTLSAKNVQQARRGSVFAGFLKLTPLFLFVMPGLIARALANNGQIQLEVSDRALPTLVGTILPMGLRGVVVAGLLAALMSSLSSVFNSCSTLITWDIYKKLHPEVKEKQLVLVGQIATIIVTLLGLLWIPFMKLISGQLYQYLQSVQGYISPPIAAVFLLGLFWKRVNATGAIWALVIGFVLGMSRLITELNKDSLSGALFTFADINFLHFAIILFLICSAVLIIVSLLTSPPVREKLTGLTYATTEKRPEGIRISQIGFDLAISVVLIACVIGIWIYFSH